MSDLISRQKAIEGVRELFSMGDCYCDELSIVGMLNGLPTAEPEFKDMDEWCTECKEYDQEKHCCHRWTKVIRKTVEEVKRQYALEYPKIIHCEDCKFYTPMNRKLKTGICSLTMHHLGDEGFCSDAEMRGE